MLLLAFLVFAAKVSLTVSQTEDIPTYKIAVVVPNDRWRKVTHAAIATAQRLRLIPRNRFAIEPVFYDLPDDDAFEISQLCCQALEEGIVAFFGPPMLDSDQFARSVIDKFGIVYLSTYLYGLNKNFHMSPALNLPREELVTTAIQDYMRSEGWDQFVILYQKDEGLLRVQRLLQLSQPHDRRSNEVEQLHKHGEQDAGMEVFARKLEAVDGDLRPLLKEIKQTGAYRFIVDCETDFIHQFLEAAKGINMLTAYFHYLFTSFDAETIDYTTYHTDKLDYNKFYANEANITFFTLHNKKVQRQEWASRFKDKNKEFREPILNMTTNEMFFFDSVLMLNYALKNLTKSHDESSRSSWSRKRTCSEDPRVGDGPSDDIFNMMGSLGGNNERGVTGLLKVGLTKGGKTQSRIDIHLDAMKVNKRTGDIEKFSEWTYNKGIFNKVQRDKSITDAGGLWNKTLEIVSISEPPFLMEVDQKPGVNLTGNDRYRGYCVDLVKELAKKLHFKYKLRVVQGYGALQADKKWDGMVGELMHGQADMAVAPLTITYNREQVVDFTSPFMNLGISILFRKPDTQEPSLFSFMSPLETKVWLYILLAYVTTSMVLFVIARFSPYEWSKNEETSTLSNQFSLNNAFWFTIGSLMQQGCDLSPQASSTRLISSVWSFFTLIIVSSYTANLAAFLTIERMNTPITSAEDLAKQTEIGYGTVNDGSTMTFFKSSKIPTYIKMWSFMESNPEMFVKNSAAGIAKVKARGYAYLMESISIEYNVAKDCELMQVGGLLDSKGYGIGLRRGSPLREELSNTILKLQEDQVLHLLKSRWWDEKIPNKPDCGDKSDAKASTTQLGIAQVGGVFVVLVAGLAASVLFAAAEFMWKARKRSKDDNKVSLGSAMWDELCFAIKCSNVKKKRPETSEREKLKKEAEAALQHIEDNGDLRQKPQHYKFRGNQQFAAERMRLKDNQFF